MAIRRFFFKYIAIIIFLICISSPAYAYLDPGTGSLIIQAAIGGIAAAAVTMKLYWYKLKGFFSRNHEEIEISQNEKDKK